MLSCRQKQKPRQNPLAKLGIFILFLCISTALIYNLQIIPVLIPLAKAQCVTELTARINSIIRNCMHTDGDGYSDFVRLTYGDDGFVASLETNTPRIAELTGDVVTAAIDRLARERMTVRIPLGNLSGGAFFTGKGPDIKVKLAVSQKITCNIRNEFYESGINQTLHRVIACVETEVYALIPTATQKFTVKVEYCIAETIIIGKVPDAYTKINRLTDDIAENEIDDIYDFGAEAAGK